MAEDRKYNVPTEENLTPSPSKVKLGAMSAPSLKIQNGEIYEDAVTELRFPRSILTYKKMVMEPSIASALSLLEILITSPEWTPYVPENASAEEKDRAAFIKWSMTNMKRPWEEYLVEFLGYLIYGFQPIEKTYSKVGKGKWKGKIAPDGFRTISPTTVTRWIYNLNTGELAGLRQEFSRLVSDFTNSPELRDKAKVHNDIPKSKFMNFRYSTKLDNPQGRSPLNSCYVPWKQKAVVQDYELIGVQRDLSGTPEIGVDIEFLAKASVAGSDEEKVLMEMKRQGASLHAGEQALVVKPIAYTESGKELFTFRLVGIDGGGRQTDTEAIIRRNENAMLMAFLADVLKLGTESHGSYSLADAKTNLLSMGVEHHLKIISNTLNHDWIRQIYALNGWEYVDGESVRMSYGDIEKPDLDVLSKYIQRVMSVGALRPTKKLESYLSDLAGVEHQENGDMEILETENKSRAGEGLGTSGTGDSQSGGANSDNNSENSA